MATVTKTRTEDVLSLIRCNLSLSKSVEELQEDYKTAYPYPHLVLDHLFPESVLDAVLEELPPLTSEKWVHEKHDRFTKSNLRSAADLETRSFEFVSVLQSAAFLYFLSEITGIRALLPDPYLSGGGYHVVPEGGKFDVHADRNTDHNSGLLRRLVMLIYLNKDWNPEWGGQLELWNTEGTKCEKVVEPRFNRAVIFEIDDKNFHGVRPVVGGHGRSRKSFASYYHTVSKDFKFHNSLYAPGIYQDKESVGRRLIKETLPPFVFRALKSLRGDK